MKTEKVSPNHNILLIQNIKLSCNQNILLKQNKKLIGIPCHEMVINTSISMLLQKFSNNFYENALHIINWRDNIKVAHYFLDNFLERPLEMANIIDSRKCKKAFSIGSFLIKSTRWMIKSWVESNIAKQYSLVLNIKKQ